MNKKELLDAFSRFDHPYEARDSVGLKSPFSRLPSSPEPYVDFVREYFTPITRDIFDGWTTELEEFYRVEGALQELLYDDGRTLEALLWIVDWAVKQADMAEFGINPLAAIRAISDAPLPRIDEGSFVHRLRDWMEKPDLAHNADACLRAILRRRPELRQGLDDGA